MTLREHTDVTMLNVIHRNDLAPNSANYEVKVFNGKVVKRERCIEICQ